MAEPTDRQIIEMAAVSGMVTGENQRREDGYYFRSQGTPTNVRDADLVEFARRARAWKPGGCIPCGGTGVIGSVASQRFMQCPDCEGSGREAGAANDSSGVAPSQSAGYTGVRCMCVDTNCRPPVCGPGCPHYSEHCRKHIEHARGVKEASRG